MPSAGLSSTSPGIKFQAIFGRKNAFHLTMLRPKQGLQYDSKQQISHSVRRYFEHPPGPGPQRSSFAAATAADDDDPDFGCPRFRRSDCRTDPQTTSSATPATAMSHHQFPHSRVSAKWLMERAFPQPCCAPAFPSNNNRVLRHVN